MSRGNFDPIEVSEFSSGDEAGGGGAEYSSDEEREYDSDSDHPGKRTASNAPVRGSSVGKKSKVPTDEAGPAAPYAHHPHAGQDGAGAAAAGAVYAGAASAGDASDPDAEIKRLFLDVHQHLLKTYFYTLISPLGARYYFPDLPTLGQKINNIKSNFPSYITQLKKIIKTGKFSPESLEEIMAKINELDLSCDLTEGSEESLKNIAHSQSQIKEISTQIFTKLNTYPGHVGTIVIPVKDSEKTLKEQSEKIAVEASLHLTKSAKKWLDFYIKEPGKSSLMLLNITTAPRRVKEFMKCIEDYLPENFFKSHQGFEKVFTRGISAPAANRFEKWHGNISTAAKELGQVSEGLSQTSEELSQAHLDIVKLSDQAFKEFKKGREKTKANQAGAAAVEADAGEVSAAITVMATTASSTGKNKGKAPKKEEKKATYTKKEFDALVEAIYKQREKETETLKKENAELKRQIAELTKERGPKTPGKSPSPSSSEAKAPPRDHENTH